MDADGVVTDPDERAALLRRTTQVLLVSVVLGGASVSTAVSVAALLARDMLANDSFAGIAGAGVQMGSALASINLASLMLRRGRRPGLQLGYAIGIVGAGIAIVFAQLEVLPLYILGMVLFGGGQSANLQSRYAAADLALTENRGRAIAMMLFGSTVGGIGGPLLVGPTGHVATWLGLHALIGPFLFSFVFYVIAWANVTWRLHPDPLVAAGGTRPDAPVENPFPVMRHALQVIGRNSNARLALATMIVSQMVMVMVMTMTPLHLRTHGHSATLSSFVISCHIAGMYAFAPMVGTLTDRRGRPTMVRLGAALLASATVVTALAGEVVAVLFLGLFLLGIGWSFGLISGSALLSESVPSEERVKVQGSADLLMSLLGGVAGFASGFIKQAIGFPMLANLGTTAALALLAAAFVVIGRQQRAAVLLG